MITEYRWLERFGENLKMMLKERGMSQRDLAEVSGLAESTISQYLHGHRLPTVKSVINIAHALGCSVNELADFGEMIY